MKSLLKHSECTLRHTSPAMVCVTTCVTLNARFVTRLLPWSAWQLVSLWIHASSHMSCHGLRDNLCHSESTLPHTCPAMVCVTTCVTLNARFITRLLPWSAWQLVSLWMQASSHVSCHGLRDNLCHSECTLRHTCPAMVCVTTCVTLNPRFVTRVLPWSAWQLVSLWMHASSHVSCHGLRDNLCHSECTLRHMSPAMVCVTTCVTLNARFVTRLLPWSAWQLVSLWIHASSHISFHGLRDNLCHESLKPKTSYSCPHVFGLWWNIMQINNLNIMIVI